MRQKMLFIGDINVDLVMAGLNGPMQRDREVSCSRFSRVMGSSVAITACAYARLGGKAGFSGLAGDDDDGHFMIDGLQKCGIDTNLVRVHPSIRTGVTVNLIEGRYRTQVTYPGTIAAYDGRNLTKDVLMPWAHAHFSGIYQQDAFRPRFRQTLAACRRAGVSASLDTQWDSTERWDGLDEWLEYIEILFVNSDEALSITGATTSEEALESLAGRVPQVVVKTGAKGAIGAAGVERARTDSPWIEVVDTTGAGDTFAAAYLRARLDGKSDLGESLRYAARAAAFSCGYQGGVNESLSNEAIDDRFGS